VSTSSALLLADLVGVAVFAASGASAAVAKRLDLFGVVFVGFVAALGGGIFRDLVINVVPRWRSPTGATRPPPPLPRWPCSACIRTWLGCAGPCSC
jgi:hypothetical protein